MSKNKYIRIAGLDLNWTESYARTYKDTLFEVGFYASVVVRQEEVEGEIEELSQYKKERQKKESLKFYVAYSHRTFTRAEADEAISNILGVESDEKEDKNNSDC